MPPAGEQPEPHESVGATRLAEEGESCWLSAGKLDLYANASLPTQGKWHLEALKSNYGDKSDLNLQTSLESGNSGEQG